MEQKQTSSDWYRNPLFAFVSGCTMGTAFAYTVLFPAYLGSAQFEIAEAQRTAARARDYELQIQQLSTSLSTAQRALSDLQYKDLFQPGSPYPLGLGAVTIGDNVDELAKRYSQHALETHDGYVSLTPNSGVFTHATFFFKSHDDRAIRQIVFSFSPFDSLIDPSRQANLDHTFVQRQLVKSLGNPTSSKGPYHYWKLLSGDGVYKSEEHGFRIMRKGLKPLAWPD